MMRLFYPAILITLVFFLSGFEKIYMFSKSTMNFSKKMKVPLTLAKIIISGVILLELIAPIIITSYTFTGLFALLSLFKTAVISLIAFTVAATIMYHNPLKGGENYYAFMSNISIIGGLLALYMCA
jgi:uncharacterized membrane protein YphA (DoxX/SURF4 family)